MIKINAKIVIYIHTIFLSTLMIANSLAADAEVVYKKDDQQGVIEFSDRPSPDAKAVEVKPNVIEVKPVKSIEPPPSAATTGEKEIPDDSVELEEYQTGAVGVGDDKRQPRKRKRRY